MKTEKKIQAYLKFSQYLLNTYWVLNTSLGTGDRAVIKPSDLKSYAQGVPFATGRIWKD